MKHLLIYSSLFCFLSFNLLGQDLNADLAQTQSFFVGEKNYSFATEIWQQANQNAEATLMNKTIVKKRNDSYRYEMPTIVSIIYPDQFLAINQETKEMIYQQINMPKPDLGLGLEGLHKQFQEVQYEGVVNGEKKYQVKIVSLEFDVAELYFDPETSILQRIKYFYVDPLADEPVYMEQHLKRLSTNPQDSDFNLQKYISTSTAGITVNEKYSDYTLVH